jgi:hypothetical protein
VFPFPDITWECLHRDFITDELISRLREKLQSEFPTELMERNREIRSQSKLKNFDVDDTRAAEDQRSIDFEPKTIAELDEFHSFLTQEARLRIIFSWSSWGALQAELKSRIVTETSLDFLLGSIDHVETKEDAFYYIKQAKPCILHLENRTLLKLFFLMLQEGLSNAEGKLLDQTCDINSMAEREAKFIEVISDVMNQEILGTIENKAQ